jgi:hypothetical protein
MNCACGKPLHYQNHELEGLIERMSARFGPEVVVEIGDKSYLVQRHYIALHGLKAKEAESLADQGIIRRP